MDGVLSFELKKHVIDGNNCIANRSNYEAKIDDHEFNIHEVYALDILVSTGEGKAKDSELRTTVYRRALDKSYTLKTKHGRTFFYELVEKFPSLCFSIRSFEDEIVILVLCSPIIDSDLCSRGVSISCIPWAWQCEPGSFFFNSRPPLCAHSGAHSTNARI